MELITVIVPIYNVERYLLRCVTSIQKQTYNNLEIILVDDGSPDNCAQICDNLMAEDSRIKVIHKKNAGIGLARNDGLEIATGTYVTFVDSDDWISETHIENLYTAIVKSQADVAFGSYTKVYANGEMLPRMHSLTAGVYERENIINDIMLPLIGTDVSSSSDVKINSSASMNLYNMDLIKTNRVRFISEKYAVSEDFFFNIDLLYYANRVVFVKEMGYYYFQNFESTCEKYNPMRFERTLNFYTTICKKVKEYKLQDKVEYRMDRSFLMKIRVAIRHVVISNINRKQKFQEIKIILEHKTTETVLSNYPIDTFIPALRLLAKCMRSKNVAGVYYLMKFREIAKRQRFLKSALKRLGIGR